MNKIEILEQIDKLYENLLETYEIAGGLRDSFSGINEKGGSNEFQLKEHCNIIMTKIYELRELKGKFINEVNKM